MVPRKRVDDSRRVLPWALLLSILAHAVLIPALLWFIVLHLMAPAVKPPEQLVLSAIVQRVTQSSASVPNHASKPQPRPKQVQPVEHPTAAPPPPRELAAIRPRARFAQPPRSHVTSMGSDIAAQEKAFALEAQQLHAQSNPLNVPTEAPVAATTFKRSYFDDPGYQKRIQGGYAILESTQQWYDGNLSCHYAHYAMSFNGGGNEDGMIPWPVCYSRLHDLLSMHVYYHVELPVPLPQPGYVLPAGTDLTPFLKQIYDQRP